MISNRLKRIYTSATGTQVYDAIRLHHPKFRSGVPNHQQSYFLVNDPDNHVWRFDVDHDAVEFVSAPMKIRMPKAGEAQQDMTIAFPNIGTVILSQIEEAVSMRDVPITVHYYAFVHESLDDLPQTDLGGLAFSEVRIEGTTITGTATRRDLYGTYILENTTFDYRWEGLWI